MYLRIVPLIRGRRARWILSITVLLLATTALAWFAPAMVGSRLLWPHALAYLTRDLDATVTTQDVTLEWFEPIVLRDVRVIDRAGQSVVSIGAVRTERSLFALLLGNDDFGKITIDQPKIPLRLRADGSNLEDALAAYLARNESSGRASGIIEITAGVIEISTAVTPLANPVRFDAIAATVTLANGANRRGGVELHSCRAAMGPQASSLTGAVTWVPAAEGGATSSTHWSVTAMVQSLDLSLLQGVLKRFAPSVALTGIADGQLEASWQSIGRGMEIDLQQLTVRQFQLAAPDILAADRLAFDKIEGQGICRAVGDTWQMENVRITCDAGHVAFDGQLPWPALPEGHTMQRLVDLARTADLTVAGRVNLARLAATLPHSLRLRDGAVIESGTMTFKLHGRNESGQRQWKVWIETSELSGRRAAQRFSWKSPLQVSVDVNRVANRWQVKQLDCQSSFLSLTGNATAAQGSFTLQCDLQQLTNQLQEFIELGSVQAAGTLSARLAWKQGDGQRVKVQGTGLVENFDLATQAIGRWREPRLAITFTAEGESADGQVARVHSAHLELASRTDQLDLQLLEPVDSPGLDALWVIGCQATGQWSSWFARLRPLLPAGIAGEASAVAGPMDAHLTARISRRAIAIERSKLTSEPFTYDSPSVRIHERMVALELAGRWDFDASRLSLTEATFQSEAVAFRVTDLGVDRGDQGIRTTGAITFRADMDKFHSTWVLPGLLDWKLGGSVQGQVSLAQLDDATQARWTIDLVGLELARRQRPAGPRALGAATSSTRGRSMDDRAAGGVIPVASGATWTTVWQEPTLKITGTGQLLAAEEMIRLERFELESADKLQLWFRGDLRQPHGLCFVDLHGQVTYDLAKLLRQWAPGLQEQVQWTGHDTQPFHLRGPLFQRAADRSHASADLQDAAHAAQGVIPLGLAGASGVSWQSADIFGISIGAGELTATLKEGTIQTGTIELPVSGGALRIEPTVHLNVAPPMISLASGRALTNVQITAGMCDQWFKYIAPVVADATEAKGQFSLSLDQATIPLDQPKAARAKGTLQVHNASVGPGPLARQLILVAGQVQAALQLKLGDLGQLSESPWIQLPQQEVHFQVVDQRVHHDRLLFKAGSVMIHTRGSVGFDQSLALVAQVPIQDQWIASNPHLVAWRGQTIQIPIGGTLSKPQFDRRALERLAADMLRKATGRIIEDEVKKGLQRWLGPER